METAVDICWCGDCASVLVLGSLKDIPACTIDEYLG